MKEAEVQKAILDYLAARHVLSFRMNTGAVSATYNGKNRFMRFGTPGMADILAFPTFGTCRSIPMRGGYYDVTLTEQVPTWIEVKAPKGVQSELQKSFQKQVEEHGHRYILARCVDDVNGVL